MEGKTSVKRAALILVVSAVLAAGIRAGQDPAGRTDTLEDSIAALAGTFGGRIGVAARDLKTGRTILVDADSLFPTASVIKLPVLVALFDKFRTGALHPDDTVSLTDSLKYGGSGVLQFFSGDAKLKLIDAAMLMIVLSDNTATNLVIDTFAPEHDARLAAVNSLMERFGLKHTHLLNKVMSWKTKKKTPESIRYGIGVSTPADMLLLLERITAGTAVDSASSRQMFDIMKNQQDVTMAARMLPYERMKEGEQIVVANKTGWVSETKVDVGIVSSPATRYAYAIFADNSTDTSETVDNRAVLAVARASRIIYDAFTQRDSR